MQIRSFSSLMESYERLIARPNPANDHFYNGLYTRYRYPVLTREHIPPFWMYDADPASNPFMMQRLGVNATMNSGAIKLNGKYCLVVRVEGMDRKSFVRTMPAAATAADKSLLVRSLLSEQNTP